jgi:diacylglycerol O-acyltransferase
VSAAAETVGGTRRAQAAQRHGDQLLRLEQHMGIAVEQGLNGWLARQGLPRVLANYEYAVTYVVSAFVLLGWVYAFRPATYRWARNSFVVLNVAGLACFALYPVAPPRLLAGAPFVDTVTQGRTFASWGSPVVAHANQLAAMPSLHIAWALWVTVVLAGVSTARWVQGLSVVHVLLTTYVIMATANHYLLDAAGGAVLVALTMTVMALHSRRPWRVEGSRVAPADAFFLHAESPAWPQQVGGLVVMAEDPDATEPYAARLRARVRQGIDLLPRSRQRLASASRWRRPRWVDAPALDWEWHLPHRDLTRPDGTPGGPRALDAYVAELLSEPLPRDRPLWRFAAVTGFAPGSVAAVLVAHHVIADGIGTIARAAQLLDLPPVTVPPPPPRVPVLRRAAAVTAGLAQLATDGGSRHRLPSRDDPARGFGTLAVDLAAVRAIATRHRVRVTDVLLSAVAGGLSRVLGTAAPPALRVTVPLMVEAPGAAGGNTTAAVITTVPLRDVPEAERLAEVGRTTRGTRRDTRALASRFVMGTLARALPPPVHAWFARTVYGFRFFQVIVSNMPGPRGTYRLAGGAVTHVYPVLPPGRRAPVAVGAIGWDGVLCVSVTVAPDLVDDTATLVDAVRAVLAELGRTDVPVPAPSPVPGEPVTLELD